MRKFEADRGSVRFLGLISVIAMMSGLLCSIDSCKDSNLFVRQSALVYIQRSETLELVFTVTILGLTWDCILTGSLSWLFAVGTWLFIELTWVFDCLGCIITKGFEPEGWPWFKIDNFFVITMLGLLVLGWEGH